MPFGSPVPGEMLLLPRTAVMSQTDAGLIGAIQFPRFSYTLSTNNDPANLRKVTTDHVSVTTKAHPVARPSHSRSLSELF